MFLPHSSSLPAAPTSDKASNPTDTAFQAPLNHAAGLKSARKESRLGAGPLRIAKPAERVPAGGKEKASEAKGRYSVRGWR